MYSIDPAQIKRQIGDIIPKLRERKADDPAWAHDHFRFYFRREPIDHTLYQGDVIFFLQETAQAPNLYYDEQEACEPLPCQYALLLSNTCDMQLDVVNGQPRPRENFVQVMPLDHLLSPTEMAAFHHDRGEPPQTSRERTQYENFVRDIRTYAGTSTFYLPPTPRNPLENRRDMQPLPALYGEFGQAQPISSRWLNESLRNGDVVRLTSLSQRGYYFLLLRLSAYFLRPDERWDMLPT